MADVVAGPKPGGPRGLGDMLKHNWYLGLTSFGGPAVHFQIVGNKLNKASNLISAADRRTVSPIIR